MKRLAAFIILIVSTSAFARFEIPAEVSVKDRVVQMWTRFKAKVQEAIKTDAAPATQVAQNGEKKAEPAPVRIPASESWQQAAQKIKDLKLARTLTPGEPAKDPNLTQNQAKVPAYDFNKLKKQALMKKVKRVPLLYIGFEDTLDPNVFEAIHMMTFPTVKPEKHELASPALATVEQFKKDLGPALPVVGPAEKIPIPVLTAEKRVTAEKINSIVFSPQKEFAWTDVPTVKFSDEDLKLLRALILYDKKDLCHIASGIFAGLVNSQNPKVKVSSEFHLGHCLHIMNLPTEAQFYLDKVIKSQDPVFAPQAFRISFANVKGHLEEEFVEALLNRDEKLIPADLINDVYYLKAKYFARKAKYEEALKWTSKIGKNSDKFYKGAFIAVVANYFTGKQDAALTMARQLVEDLKSKDNDKELLALAQIQLGRMAFQKGKYKESMEAFQKVGKDNSHWIQALTEQGWAQIQSKDSAGAIGNMHSIQSPFFDSVYKPESYIVRSIGYLSMCQYADSYKTLAYLDNKYLPWLEQLAAFNKSHNPPAMYDAVVKSIQLQNKVPVDGLAPQVLREVARQRDFLNTQDSINALIDEASGYPFIQGVVEKDKKALVSKKTQSGIKIADLELKIRQNEKLKTPQAKKAVAGFKSEISSIHDFLAVYEFKMATYREGEDGFKKLSPVALDRVTKIKGAKKEIASIIVKNHFAKMARQLRNNFDNNELLKYEIFAGSGENLRYQVSGGKVMGMPKELERKLAAQNWDFDGEFWEDEIGHYRSALKNNCKRE